MDYRFYLLDRYRRIVAVDAFDATADAEAKEIARTIYGACDDVFGGFELWKGAAVLETDRSGFAYRPLSLEDVTQRRQQIVCEREQALADMNACVHQSVKLLAAISSNSRVGKVDQAPV